MTPNADKCIELGNIFLNIAKTYPQAKVDMDECEIGRYEEHNLCGTYACHAGWFELYDRSGNVNDMSFQANSMEEDDRLIFDFLAGAEKMADFLGMESVDELENWARENPDKWGNGLGNTMFSEDSAFTGNYSDTVTLEQIGQHWIEVGKRLKND